jgi:hypothetical protein
VHRSINSLRGHPAVGGVPASPPAMISDTLRSDGFGKACAEMFGPRKRLRALQNGTGNSTRRPWGYHVPKGKKWQEKVDARPGIKN